MKAAVLNRIAPIQTSPLEITELQTPEPGAGQVRVKVRCLGALQQKPRPGDAALGRPVLFELEPMQFWVQRGRPRRYWKQGYINCHPKLRALVDRVELELSYR